VDVGSSATSGTGLVLNSCNGGSSQQFNITANATNGSFNVVSASSGLCMSVRGQSQSSGAVMDVETCSSNIASSQQFNIQATSYGTVNNDAAEYSFETGTQGWTFDQSPITSVAQSTNIAYNGGHSLAVNFNGNGTAMTEVMNPSIAAGKVVTFNVYIPTGAPMAFLQPYVQQGSAGSWTWTGNYQTSGIKYGQWNTLTVTVPSNASALYRIGVQFSTNASFNGTFYVDTVSY
jgi:hypothetical protein